MITIESTTNSSNVQNLRKLRLIPIDDVLEIVEPIHDDWTVPVNGIITKHGTTIIEVKFGYKMASFSEDLQKQNQGVSYIQKVDAIIPRDCPQIVTGVNFLQNRKFLGLIKDGNGRVRILGTKKQPLKVTGNSLTIGINARTLSLSTEVKQQGYFYGSLEEVFLIGRQFNTAFSLNFR